MKTLDKEFERLVNKMVDEQLTETEAAQLDQFLADPENMDYYLRFCGVEGKLEEKKGDFSRNLVKAAIIANKPAPRFTQFIKYAAIIVVVLSLGYFVGKGKPTEKVTAGEDNKVIYERGVVVATIDSSIMSDFEYGGKNGAQINAGDQAHSGTYYLKSGIVKLAYENKSTAILESPCSYELLSDDSIRLISGKISVYSPGKTNFRVQCAGVFVEALGTEFSMELKEKEYVELHVFDGVVRLETTEENSRKKQMVKEGEAVRVLYSNDGAELEIAGVDIKNDHFIRQLSSPNERYSREIVKMNPALYYPMDVVEDNILRDYSSYKNDGQSRKVKNPAKFFTSGKFGTAIRIGGANKQSYVFVDDFPKSKEGKFTGMAWVKADSRPVWATIIKNWLGNTKGQFHFGLSQHGHLDIEIVPENVKFLKGDEYKNIKNVIVHGDNSVHLSEEKKFPLNSWQHVAFVHDSKKLYLYRNGELVASLKTPPLKLPIDLKVMSIGTKLNDEFKQSLKQWPSHWDGKLDEIALFHYAMSAEDIKYVYEQIYSEGTIK